MGRQQSFVQFESVEALISEMKKYQQRDAKLDVAGVYCINRVKKEVFPFTEGDLVVVIGGERYAQRNKQRLNEELGLSNIKEIMFIDSSLYWELSNGNLGEFLDDHFETLSNEEVEELLK